MRNATLIRVIFYDFLRFSLIFDWAKFVFTILVDHFGEIRNHFGHQGAYYGVGGQSDRHGVGK